MPNYDLLLANLREEAEFAERNAPKESDRSFIALTPLESGSPVRIVSPSSVAASTPDLVEGIALESAKQGQRVRIAIRYDIRED